MVRSKVPWSLLSDPTKTAKMELTASEPFEDTFGAKSKRKRPKLSHLSYEELLENAEQKTEDYEPEKDRNILGEEEWKLHRNPLFDKGQSKRIWAELFKVMMRVFLCNMLLDSLLFANICNTSEKWR